MEKIGQPADYLSGEDLEKYVKEYEAGAKEVIEKYGLN
jgi:tripartite-type tricarboxylate transporter receptor subunit TctC